MRSKSCIRTKAIDGYYFEKHICACMKMNECMHEDEEEEDTFSGRLQQLLHVLLRRPTSLPLWSFACCPRRSNQSTSPWFWCLSPSPLSPSLSVCGLPYAPPFLSFFLFCFFPPPLYASTISIFPFFLGFLFLSFYS